MERHNLCVFSVCLYSVLMMAMFAQLFLKCKNYVL